MTKKLNIAITTGEPAGIGIEISLKAAIKYLNNDNLNIILIGDREYLKNIAQKCGIDILIFNQLTIHHIPLIETAYLGVLNPNNAKYVLNLLDYAIDNCLNNTFDGVVTAPIHKGILNTKDFKFSGHTEYLALKTKSSRVIMLLSGIDKFRQHRLRVALATTHIPLNKVANNLNTTKIINDINLLNNHLITYFNIQNPLIKVAGLNPHAGENGHIGSEDMEIILPAVKQLQEQNINIEGPFAGDTLFLQKSDCFYCMYHDQGLAPFKYATFGKGVNITLGLPIIRTSVDHGTAIDIADKFSADVDSMHQAIAKAIFLINNKKTHEKQ